MSQTLQLITLKCTLHDKKFYNIKAKRTLPFYLFKGVQPSLVHAVEAKMCFSVKHSSLLNQIL